MYSLYLNLFSLTVTLCALFKTLSILPITRQYEILQLAMERSTRALELKRHSSNKGSKNTSGEILGAALGGGSELQKTAIFEVWNSKNASPLNIIFTEFLKWNIF